MLELIIDIITAIPATPEQWANAITVVLLTALAARRNRKRKSIPRPPQDRL